MQYKAFTLIAEEEMLPNSLSDTGAVLPTYEGNIDFTQDKIEFIQKLEAFNNEFDICDELIEKKRLNLL